MKTIELLPGELRLGAWTLNYLPPAGGRYTGPLVVTDRRLLFRARFDASPGRALRGLAPFRDTHGLVAIPRERVRRVEKRGRFPRRQLAVILDNGETHLFDRGLLGVDRLAAAVGAGAA
ncbi:MAG TPA: hypothetical protein PK919_08665 [Candidatus Aminicenantes bacterium]|nr:hypothetical protein [Candidatus Aminicenantes bacterium]